jgi:hypothetical protein
VSLAVAIVAVLLAADVVPEGRGASAALDRDPADARDS